MTDLPLSATSCTCGEPNCNSFSCCAPTEYKKRPCTIKPDPVEICIDYDSGEDFVEEGYFEALIVDEQCGKLIITENCIPIYGKFKIEE